MLARVELEGGLGAPDLEVDAAVRVARGDEPVERGAARVDGHGAGGLGVQHEAVVDVGLGVAEDEGRVGAALELGVGRGARGGDAVGVDGEVGVGGDADLGAGDGGGWGEVEVAVFCVLSWVSAKLFVVKGEEEIMTEVGSRARRTSGSSC